jgi:hypothetical protein
MALVVPLRFTVQPPPCLAQRRGRASDQIN